MYRSNGRGVVFATLLFGFIAADVPAATLSYRLEQSNRLPDGSGYLEVTIADGPSGSIDFTVTALPALIETAGRSLEIQSFAFNAASGARPTNVTGLPERWVARGPVNMDGFGRFGIQLWSNAPEALQALSFSIVDVEGDTPWSYVVPSARFAREGNANFAAQVRFSPDSVVPGAFIGGGSEVPLPATGWMAAAGFAWILRRARRRRAMPELR